MSWKYRLISSEVLGEFWIEGAGPNERWAIDFGSSEPLANPGNSFPLLPLRRPGREAIRLLVLGLPVDIRALVLAA